MVVLLKIWKSAVWTIIMLVAFLLPAKSLSGAPSTPFLSESVHMFMFAAFTWFLFHDLAKSKFNTRQVNRNYILTLMVSLLFGTMVEILQELSGLGRKAETKDVLFDLCGILFSIGIIMLFSRLKAKSVFKD